MTSCLLSFGSSPDLSIACSFSAFSVYLEFSISCRRMLMCERMRTDREETIISQAAGKQCKSSEINDQQKIQE